MARNEGSRRGDSVDQGRLAGLSALPQAKGKLTVERFVVPYRVYGTGDLSLVFINGVQQSMAMWHSFVRRFSRKYRIVLFDFPNQGAGRIVSGSAQLTLEEQVEILDAVIGATVGGEPTSVCSASWGGVVALAYAVRYPEKLKNLILASIGTKANQKLTEIISRGLAMPVKDRLEVAETLIENFGQELPEAMKKRIVGQFERMGAEAFQAFFQHGSTVISVQELGEVVDVSRVRCRTILLYGENDAMIDVEDVRYLAGQMARAELRLVPGVGHFLHLEKEELLDVYEDILASL
jgi:pimeloyl-ACP methyl ester carboxylesterase